MPEFAVRALEIHSDYVWDFDWVRKALEFVRRHDMTGLHLHRNDIVDRIVYPGRIFGAKRSRYRNIFERYQDIHRALYKYTPTRRSGPYQRRDYLNRVVDLAARQGTAVYLQNKEFSFHEIVLELNPGLTKGGAVCPNEPFWWDFIRTKYDELLEDVPGIAGIITAPASSESRLSIAGNRCRCELCAGVTPQAWYRKLLHCMYEPLHGAGKQLVVRDFVFDRRTQSQLAEVMETLPADVVMALKNTPHDYYPTFPHNPRIGHVGAHRQWIEFDAMGQYFGWGIGPCSIVEEMRTRFRHALDRGADGVIVRTDWESLDGHTCFHTPNLVNLHAGARLARDLATPGRDVYREWLVEAGMVDAAAGDDALDECARWAESLFTPTREAICAALYTNGCVFSDSSNFPVSAAHAWWLAEEKNSLRDWDPSKHDAMATDAANVERIIAEKEQAVAVVERLVRCLEAPPAALLPAALADLRARFDIFHRYVRGFREIGRACALALHVAGAREHQREPEPSVTQRLAEALDGLLALAGEFREFARRTDHRHVVYLLLGWERLEALHADLSRLATGAREEGTR